MLITNSNKKVGDIQINNIETRDFIKYLGIYIDKNLNWDYQILLRHQPKSLRSCTRDSTTHAQVSCIIHGGKQVTLFLEEHFHA